MIHAEDLRIGNKFKGIAGIQTVLEIHDNTSRGKTEYVSDFQREGYKVLIMCEENGNQYKPIEIDGIRITEDILKDAGFNRHTFAGNGSQVIVNYCEWRYKWFWLSQYSNKQDIFTFHGIEYRYVHELQNLFAAVQGRYYTSGIVREELDFSKLTNK